MFKKIIQLGLVLFILGGFSACGSSSDLNSGENVSEAEVVVYPNRLPEGKYVPGVREVVFRDPYVVDSALFGMDEVYPSLNKSFSMEGVEISSVKYGGYDFVQNNNDSEAMGVTWDSSGGYVESVKVDRSSPPGYVEQIYGGQGIGYLEAMAR